MGKNKQLHSVLARSGMNRSRAERGFTLVELLVVIVVIAILASIAAISYRGIQARAAETVLRSDLRGAGNQLEIGMAQDGAYASNDSGLSKSPGTEYQYDSTHNSYCLTATSSKSPKAFYISSDAGVVREGVCPDTDHTGPNPDGGSTVASGDPIQNLTSSQCSSMEVYTGSNSGAILTLEDSRGGTTQNYQVAKLADGNCWMLNNLKLGSASKEIELTSGDSDVSSSGFILPKVYSVPTSTERSHDKPKAYIPVNSSGSGATDYGYLYSWPAATAGETRTSMPASSGDASHSICPKNWRLPTGGTTAGASDFSRLDQAFGGAGVTQTGTPAHLATGWHHSGAFKGVFSGGWLGTLGYHRIGVEDYLWSRSASETSANGAFHSNFGSTYVSPGNISSNRYYAFGVRCLLG